MDLVLDNDPHRMNWLRPDYPYAEVRLPRPFDDGEPSALSACVETERDADEVRTTVTITNVSPHPVFTRATDVGITLPLQDRYDDAVTCATQRCHAHVFCGGTSSYVLALRMGGDAPHLGLVLTEGDLVGYGIERDLANQSNDRGCFVLHPAPLALAPGESTRVSWTIFPCADRADFVTQALERTSFVHASWSRYVLFPGEIATLRVRASNDPASVTVDGVPAQPDGEGAFTASFTARHPGEHELVVRADDRTVRTRLLVKEPLEVLLERRCAFIAAHQQYDGPIDRLRGAFLVYDNEEQHTYYDVANDYNGGRERIGMGVLLATYLLAVRDGVVTPSDPATPPLLRAALDRHVEYVRCNLVDPSGTSYNDTPRDGSYQRLYNAPWYATYFLALHALDGGAEDLLLAHRIIRRYYADGGASFYPIELPVEALCEALASAGLDAELTTAREAFYRHARHLAATGHAYPTSEVNYEQSIVAPAADVLLQTYRVTGDGALLEAARAQLHVLEQFNGFQPDHHLNEVAIRHWDGYWFGKRRRYGDTFPHYWSGLTGNVFAAYAAATGDGDYARRAEDSHRGVLPLIHDDGTASCAHLFPLTVNGEPGGYDDPYANDQDWALVFTLRRLLSSGRREDGR